MTAKEIPTVFIIGPPRSGTTLVCQVLLNRYRFAYFTNFVALFSAAPAIGFRLASFLPSKQPPVDYRSRHGRTAGLHGPHECGRFWYRWFPRGDEVYVPPGATSKKMLDNLRGQIARISHVTGLPVLFKNTFNSLRIAPIVEALPQASFLVCQRDPVDTAQSILKARMELLGAKDKWWSLPPREIDQIKNLPYWSQVVEQVYYTYRQIDADRQQFGAARFLDIDYNEFCQDTHAELSRVAEFLEARCVPLEIRGEVPPQFTAATGRRVDPDDYQRIVERVQQLWPERHANEDTSG